MWEEEQREEGAERRVWEEVRGESEGDMENQTGS